MKIKALARPVRRLAGRVSAPGDKSCSHRFLMMAATAEGTSTARGLLDAEDVLNTAAAMQALGAHIERSASGWRVTGVGPAGFQSPAHPLDFGNSGTGVRLAMGLVAGHAVSARFTGDESLSARPMERVLAPLRLMGARAETAPGGTLPVHLVGGSLQGVRYAPPEASAQVKSAVLLAGLRASGETMIEERTATRDHTERMLRAFGVRLEVAHRAGRGPVIALAGGQALTAVDADIPGDPSSAAFSLAAALIASDAEVDVCGVMANPTRDGFLRAVQMMGGDLDVSVRPDAAGEASVDVRARASRLRGIDLDPDLVPSMIDELPIFAVLAAFAEGVTRVTGASELRVKESDRIRAICAMLTVNGVRVEELPDGFVVHGCGPGGTPGGGRVDTRHDHRIAMSGLVMGGAAQAPVAVDDVRMIATSYRTFPEDMRALGAALEIDAP